MTGAANLNGLAAQIAATAMGSAQTPTGLEPAGHAHVQLCDYCRAVPLIGPANRPDGTCKCPDQCNRYQCPAPPKRTDGAAYSEGFTPPPVPTFERRAA